MQQKPKNASQGSELGKALAACRGTFIAIGVLSAVLNILALSGSLFMLEVYDRVLPSRSLPTLAGLLVLVITLYVFQGLTMSRRRWSIADRSPKARCWTQLRKTRRRS